MFERHIYFAPDEGGGAGEAAPQTTTTPSIQSTPTAPVASPTPTAPAAATTSTDQVSQFNLLSGLRERGVVGRDVSDERAALDYIARLHQEHQQARPYALAYVQNYDQFQKFLQQQQAPQAAPAAEEKKPWWHQWWQPPTYDPNWRSMIGADGQPMAGAPPDIASRIGNYDLWHKQQIQRLASNPFEFMEPAIDARAREIAEKIISEKLGGYTDQQRAQSVVQQHESWLYERDAAGQPVFEQVPGPGGFLTPQKKLSQWGQRFSQHVYNVAAQQKQRGYSDVQEQEQLALMRVQNEFAAAQLRDPAFLQAQLSQLQGAAPAPAAAPVNPREAANETFLQQRGGTPAPVRPTRQSTVQQPPRRQTLGKMLREGFKKDGITDAVLAAEN